MSRVERAREESSGAVVDLDELAQRTASVVRSRVLPCRKTTSTRN
jgi:hypothetical protein